MAQPARPVSVKYAIQPFPVQIILCSRRLKMTDAVRVHCLALGGVDLTSAAGKMTLSVLNAVAEFERDLLIERTQAGIARAEGKVLGRPSALTKVQQAEAMQRLVTGESVAKVACDYGTTRQSIMRVRERLGRSSVADS